MLDAATSLNDLRSPPANRLEALVGNRRGQHSIRVIDAIVACRIEPVIDRTFDFDEAPAAYRLLESAAHFGKIVVRI